MADENKITAQILQALDLKDLPEENQEELLLELSSLVMEGTLLRLMDRMDDQTKDALSALMDTDPSEDEVADFLEDHVPDADQALQETIAAIRSDILGVTGGSQD